MIDRQTRKRTARKKHYSRRETRENSKLKKEEKRARGTKGIQSGVTLKRHTTAHEENSKQGGRNTTRMNQAKEERQEHKQEQKDNADPADVNKAARNSTQSSDSCCDTQ